MAQEDALAIAQNGGISSSDEGDLDGDADDLDDDMMDKISSSPSIEDGGCRSVTVPTKWPRRVSSLPTSLRSSSPTSLGSSGPRPCSPYPEPLHPTKTIPSSSTIPQLPTVLPPTTSHHRLQGEYAGYDLERTDCDATDDATDDENDDENDDDFHESYVHAHQNEYKSSKKGMSKSSHEG